MYRLIMLCIGYFFLVLGVLGLFLPFLQGFLFLFVGLIILAKHALWAQRCLDWIRQRFPRLGGMIDKSEAFADRTIGKCENGFKRLFGRA